MGSYNGTCGVSGLPISSGTPCRVFLLVPHGYMDKKIPGVWSPVNIIPLKGTYDDCGRLGHLGLSPAFHLEHRKILASVQEFSEEIRSQNWEIFERYPKDPGALYEVCKRKALQIKTIFGIKPAVPFYVREDVYQLVLDRARKSESFRGSFLEGCQEMITTRFKMREFEAETLGLYGPDATEADEERRKALSDEKIRIEHLDNGWGTHQGRMLLSHFWEKLQADSDLKASLEEAMLEFELFAGAMEAVHVGWQPKTVLGQDDEYEFHAQWLKELVSIADAAHKKQQEEWDS